MAPETLGWNDPNLRRAEAYTGNAPGKQTITSAAIRRRVCPEPAPDRQAIR